MSVPLMEFQRALGRLVRVPVRADPFEGLDVTIEQRARIERLSQGAGFRFTVDVQRSWCRGRAARAARLTLSVLPPRLRQQLLDDWINSGGGTASFFADEADAFLDFIAARLPDASPAQTMCRVEQATLRASEGASRFEIPDLSSLKAGAGMLHRGRHATLVRCDAEALSSLGALVGPTAAPRLDDAMTILFAPGLPGLFRTATPAEVALWERLASPVPVSTLLRESGASEVIEALTLAGVLMTR